MSDPTPSPNRLQGHDLVDPYELCCLSACAEVAVKEFGEPKRQRRSCQEKKNCTELARNRLPCSCVLFRLEKDKKGAEWEPVDDGEVDPDKDKKYVFECFCVTREPSK
jgi:hypothetical protein